MPQWAGSCWYYLRFIDPRNDRALVDPELEKYWMPVDLYLGGAEHAVLHLLYARFWHKVLFDLGLVHTAEPFHKLFNQGLITAFAYQDASGRLVANDLVDARGDEFVRRDDGEKLQQIVTKMAKQLKNVVNPDDVIAEHGADTLRVYESFMGPLADSKPWNPRDITGSRRFLERVWRLFVDPDTSDPVRPNLRVDQQATIAGDTEAIERALNRVLARVDDSFKAFNFNTAIAAMMELVNVISKTPQAFTRGQAERFALILAPFAPHMAEELWSRLGNSSSLSRGPWPTPIARYLEDDVIEIVVQVSGKMRGKVSVAKTAAQPEVERAAREAAGAWLEGREVSKAVYVPGRLINLIAK
jgi:leucyl-tRNA synthetase